MIPHRVLALANDADRALGSLVSALAHVGGDCGVATIESYRSTIRFYLAEILEEELCEAASQDSAFLAHTNFVATVPEHGVCVSCRKPGRRRASRACERCGAPFHDKCYWKRVATPREHRAWRRDPDAAYVFLCQGCRS
jgi:hypothetical protein